MINQNFKTLLTWLLLNFLLFPFWSHAQEVTFDSIQVESQMNSLVEAYTNHVSTNPSKALKNAQDLLEISQKYGYSMYTVRSYYYLGHLNHSIGEFETSIDYTKKTIQLLEELGYQKQVAACHNLIAINFRGLGKHAEAMQHFLLCLQYAKKYEQPTEEANTYLNMSNIYIEQKNFKQAKESIDRARVIFEALEDYESISACFFNLANIYKEQKQLKKAKEAFELVKEYSLKNNNIIQAINANINLAQILIEEQKYREAIPILKQNLKDLEQAGVKSDLALVLNDLGLCYKNMGDERLAIHHFEQALLIPEITLQTESEIHQNLAQLYHRQKQYQKAYQYLQSAQQHSEELHTTAREKYTAEIQQKYETQLKENQIEILEKEKSLQKAKLENQELTLKRYFLMGVFAVILFIAMLAIGRIYYQRLKDKKELAVQKEENTRQKIHRLIDEHKINAIERFHEGQEEERSRIACEMHDGIGSDLASLKISVDQYVETKGNDKLSDKIQFSLQNIYKDVRSISHRLKPPVFSSVGFSDFLQDYFHHLSSIQKIQYEVLLFPEHEINLVTESTLVEVYRVLQELSNNIQKHAHATQADIQLTLHEDYLNIVVSDNGQGFQHAKKGGGIGLRNIKDRIRKLYGVIDIDSSPQGSTVIINIPAQYINQSTHEKI